MARKSKDPKKPSQAFLRAIGQSAPTENDSTPIVDAVVDEPTSAEAILLRKAIKDLGGDDEDFELLKGLSDEEEEVEEEKPKAKKSQKGQVDEVSILHLWFATCEY
jgi:hypothetical protein